jgi:hypothetical protein
MTEGVKRRHPNGVGGQTGFAVDRLVLHADPSEGHREIGRARSRSCDPGIRCLPHREGRQGELAWQRRRTTHPSMLDDADPRGRARTAHRG